MGCPKGFEPQAECPRRPRHACSSWAFSAGREVENVGILAFHTHPLSEWWELAARRTGALRTGSVLSRWRFISQWLCPGRRVPVACRLGSSCSLYKQRRFANVANFPGVFASRPCGQAALCVEPNVSVSLSTSRFHSHRNGKGKPQRLPARGAPARTTGQGGQAGEKGNSGLLSKLSREAQGSQPWRGRGIAVPVLEKDGVFSGQHGLLPAIPLWGGQTFAGAHRAQLSPALREF